MRFKLSIVLYLTCFLFANDHSKIIKNSSIDYGFANKYLKIDNDLNKTIARSVDEKRYKYFSENNIEPKIKKYELNNTKIINLLDKDYLKNKDAHHVVKKIYSKEFNEKLDEQKQYILNNISVKNSKMMLPKQISPKVRHPYSIYKGVDVTTSFNNKFGFTKDKHLYIVISSSMPKKQIQEYFKRVDGNNDITFVLRGLIGGIKEIIPTREYILELIKKDTFRKKNKDVYKVNISINPKITRYYKIDKVPAFIFTKNKNETLSNHAKIAIDNNETYFIAYGLVDLDYALENINKKAKSKWLDELLKRGRFF